MYKAFVSSTFKDLNEHRSEVIRTLIESGFQVDPMENWPADRNSPQSFSPERLKGCQICILIVGFRRGHIPDGSSRSITQIEYDEAKRRGIDILPFLLDDNTFVGGDSGWNSTYDERNSDAEIMRWRKYLRETHGVGEFGQDPNSLRIETAISRWVVQKVADSERRFHRILTSAFAGLFVLLTAGFMYSHHVYKTPELRNEYHSKFLGFHDPEIFNNSPTGQYEFGRVLDSYSTLVGETKFAEEILATKQSLDFIVNNFYTRHAQKENFLKIIENGAKLRIILWDYTVENQPAYDAFHLAIKQTPEGPRGEARNVHSELLKWKRQIETDPKKYKGALEFRWNSSPLLYTMWVRDWGTPQSIGHLGIHFYRGQEYWPNVRVSPHNANRLLNNLHAEFEEAWSRSKILPDPI